MKASKFKGAEPITAFCVSAHPCNLSGSRNSAICFHSAPKSPQPDDLAQSGIATPV